MWPDSYYGRNFQSSTSVPLLDQADLNSDFLEIEDENGNMITIICKFTGSVPSLRSWNL